MNLLEHSSFTFIVLLGLSAPLGACDTGQDVDAGAAGTAGSTPVSGAAGAGTGGTAGVNAGGAGTPGGSSGIAGLSGGGNAAGGNGTSGNGSGGVSGSDVGGASGSGGNGVSGAGAGGSSGNTSGSCKDDFWPATNSGSVTRYDFNQGTSLPACAYAITHTGSGSDGDWDTVEGISTGDGGYFGAMNTADYAQGAACGACVEASYNGKKVVLTIVDECPVNSNPLCQKGHIDLSRKAIRQLESNSSLENLKNVSWRYVQCPAAGNVKARLHPNQNGGWQPVVIENGLYPLKSVTLNGVNASRSGNNQGGNAWSAAGQKPPYVVKAVDVNDGAVSFNYDGGGLKDVGTQFSCK